MDKIVLDDKEIFDCRAEKVKEYEDKMRKLEEHLLFEE